MRQFICKVYTEIKEVLEEKTLRRVHRVKWRKSKRPRVTSESIGTYSKTYQHHISENLGA